MTIAFVICPSEKKHLLKRIVSKVYSRIKATPGTEVKGSSLSQSDKEFVARQTVNLLKKHPDIKIVYITVQKENVQPLPSQRTVVCRSLSRAEGHTTVFAISSHW